jgi:hypothetical protein
MKCSHLKDIDVYIIDYSGMITYEKGLSNMSLIEKKIRKLSLHNAFLKLLCDMRNTRWENRETHDRLSAIARKMFSRGHPGFMMRIAILHDELEIPEFGNERWFVDKEEALRWLAQKR